MLQRTLRVILVCLGLVAAGVFVYSYRMRSDAAPGVAVSEEEDEAVSLPAPTVFLEPAAGFDWLYGLVGRAKSSIDVAMYELVDPAFSGELVQACARGVKVRVILDQNLEKTANTPAYTQLASAGPNCTVAWANPHFQAAHQKTIVLDEQTIVVMTFNLTSRYYSSTRDIALVDRDKADALSTRLAFEHDFGSTETDPEDPGIGHNLIWSPTTAGDDLVSLIQGAKKTLLVENEELGADVIVKALAAACKRGVKVELAMTDTNPNYHANYKALEAAGCGVHIGANDPDTLYIHAKAMMIDQGTADAVGYVGSINFTNPSMNENRELGLYVHDPAVLGQIGATLASDYAQFPAYAGS